VPNRGLSSPLNTVVVDGELRFDDLNRSHIADGFDPGLFPFEYHHALALLLCIRHGFRDNTVEKLVYGLFRIVQGLKLRKLVTAVVPVIFEQRFDKQWVFPAKGVVKTASVDPGPLDQVSDRRGLEAFLPKHLHGLCERVFLIRIESVRHAYIDASKHDTQWRDCIGRTDDSCRHLWQQGLKHEVVGIVDQFDDDAWVNSFAQVFSGKVAAEVAAEDHYPLSCHLMNSPLCWGGMLRGTV